MTIRASLCKTAGLISAVLLASVFLRVHVVPCSDERFGGEDNYLLLATDADVDVPAAVPYDRDFMGAVLRD